MLVAINDCYSANFRLAHKAELIVQVLLELDVARFCQLLGSHTHKPLAA